MSRWRKVWLQLDLLWKSSISAHYSTSPGGRGGRQEQQREGEGRMEGGREMEVERDERGGNEGRRERKREMGKRGRGMEE